MIARIGADDFGANVLALIRRAQAMTRAEAQLWADMTGEPVAAGVEIFWPRELGGE